MTVKELIVYLLDVVDQGCGDAHATVYDEDLRMPAIVQGAVYNEYSLTLLTIPSEQ